jgi:hydroxyacylglutathione hydrolase
LAAWAGWFVNYDEPLYLIIDSARVEEAIVDLRAIGVDQIGGYFTPQTVENLSRMDHPIQQQETITPSELVDRLRREAVLLIDVRTETEWQSGRIPGAQHIMLGYLPHRSHEVINGLPIVVTCQSGRRSAIGTSILQARGAKEVFNLQGGVQEWVAAGLPLEK